MDRYGIDFETEPVVIAVEQPLPLDLPRLLALTGESGAGKSTLLRAAARDLRDRGARVVDLDDLTLGTRPVIDRIGGSLDDAIATLSRCGLGEARLMLRLPSELSEGQRYRLRLALAVDALRETGGWIVADEFTATLDRTLAKVLARNVHRLAQPGRLGFVLATTHEDILPDLAPHTHVHCRLDEQPLVHTADQPPAA